MPSVNPDTWKSFNLNNPGQRAIFQQQLPQYLSETSDPGYLATQISGSNGGVSGSAISTKQFNESATSTLNCANALNVSINVTLTSSITLTLQNLAIGTTVTLDVNNTSGTTHTLTIAATTPTNIAYVAIKGNTSGGSKNFLAGATIGATTELIFNGQTTTGPNLVMVGN